jgi:hypothetical protein
MGPRICLDEVAKRLIIAHARNRFRKSPVVKNNAKNILLLLIIIIILILP